MLYLSCTVEAPSDIWGNYFFNFSCCLCDWPLDGGREHQNNISAIIHI